jgi:predicted porin
LAATTGAFAQSTVTLFGAADLNYRNVTTGANKFSGMSQDGLHSSRFGVNGVEDLGGGLKANFHFEGGMNPDVGTSAGFNFTRKSTIGVAGGFGEVRMGRDYTPLFTVSGVADPFGTSGVGSSYNLANSLTFADPSASVDANKYDASVLAAATSFATAQAATAAGTGASSVKAGVTLADPNAVRANNSIAYYTPTFNGFSAGFMYGFGGENTALARAAGTMTSLKLSYANGPLTVAYGNQVTKGGVPAANAAIAAVAGDANRPAITASSLAAATDSQKYTTNFLAGSYDLGIAKVSAGYKTDKLSLADAFSGTAKSTILGVAAPVGALTLKASYVARKVESEKVANQVAFGAVYDLSKRTSVYAAYSVLKNEEGSGLSVGSAAASDFTGLKSKGFEAGVKHSF